MVNVCEVICSHAHIYKGFRFIISDYVQVAFHSLQKLPKNNTEVLLMYISLIIANSIATKKQPLYV